MESLNVSAWLTASASFGAKYSVLVADHMAGFTLWPTKVHPVSIASTSFEGGNGDIVKDFRVAAAAQGIAPGFFYSTHYNWALGVDNYRAEAVPRTYGGPLLNQSAFEDLALAQLAELHLYESDGHGPWSEVWFDGSVNTILTPKVGSFVKQNFPNAVCHSCVNFSQTGSGSSGDGRGIRWMGNEEGAMPLPSWGASFVNYSVLGDPTAPYFIPPSCDTVLEEHYWFWQQGDTKKLRSTCALTNVYLTSVGRSSNFILNLAPDQSGGLQPEEVIAYQDLGDAIRCLWNTPIAQWTQPLSVDLQSGIILLPLTTPFTCTGSGTCTASLVLQEDLSLGQRIGEWTVEVNVEGKWVPALNATMPKAATTGIGHKRIFSVLLPNNVTINEMRVRVISAYTAAGDEAAPMWLIAAGLFDRGGATTQCLPNACTLVDY